ncbi:MAG: hypothetical protein ABI640_09430 [Gammaproteobacteria bacterium]
MRSASALTAGVVHEVAAVALPLGLRRGKLYRNLVDVPLSFLISDVGQVPGDTPTDQQLGENFLLRRAAGNGIEIMGILAFRASPVWVLAALADICGFGRRLIPEIAAELRREGLLGPGKSFATMEQLLQGLEKSAAHLASTVNTPPLDVASLRREWTQLVAEARQLPAPGLPGPTAVTGLWKELRATADNEGRSVFEVSSLLAVSAVSELPERARVLSRAAGIVLKRGGAALSGALLDHYRKSLAELRAVGFMRYGMRQLAPYTHAALAAFDRRRETSTGRLLDRL